MKVRTTLGYYFVMLMGVTLVIFGSCKKEEDHLPTISTLAVTGTTDTTAESGGHITHDGGSAVTSRGVVWSINEEPTTDQHTGITVEGEGAGQFYSVLTGLTAGTQYYVRAYASNAVGTAYGSQVSFTTDSIPPGFPAVVTAAVTNIDATTATAGGEVTSRGASAVIARGVCYGSSPLPDLSGDHTVDGAGVGEFISSLSALDEGTTYYIRAYATNGEGTSFGHVLTFTTDSISVNLPVVTTTPATGITPVAATTGGEVTSEGSSAVTARGVCWGTSPLPDLTGQHTVQGTGSGAFTSQLKGLSPGITYYVRAYATNTHGTSYGSEDSFTAPVLNPEEVINPATGRVWLDRNLGASNVATSSNDAGAYGDLYQWGRAEDGHQVRTSNTTTTPASNDTPAHGDFILSSGAAQDWRIPQNHNLWQGINGINNPCPAGFRIPTAGEWQTEIQSWNSNDATGAFESPLKLTAAGHRYGSSGSIGNVGTYGSYWTSSTDGSNARLLYFYSINATTISFIRASGLSIRCIMD